VDEEALAHELAATYAAESQERLEALTRLLLDLEQDRLTVPVATQIELIYREVHSLKGAARSIGVATTEAVAHTFEDQLATARGAASVSPPTVADWFAHLDQLRSTISGGDGDGAASTSIDPVDPEIASLRSSAASSVRIATERLDGLMEDLGSLIVAEQAREEALTQLSRLARELAMASRLDHDGRSVDALQLERMDFRERLQVSVRALEHLRTETHRQIQALDDDVRGLRMMPIKPLFLSFERMVRDLAVGAGKEVDLQVTGEETELDRAIVDDLRDPLVHLLRNAIDHGVETVEERVAAGKPATARIQLTAVPQGSQVVIMLEDDGRGLDHAGIARRAVKLHLLAPDEADGASQTELHDLLFRSGFSTRDEVSEISGRGLGLAIVREAIERLRGSVVVNDAGPALGTRFTITVPLTLATTRCFLLAAGSETYAIPIHAIKRIIAVERTEMRSVEGRPAIEIDGQAAGFFHLAAVLNRSEVEGADRLPTFVFESPAGPLAIAGDVIRGELDLVVKGFPPSFPATENLAGAATLASGEVVLVVDPGALVRSALLTQRDIPGIRTRSREVTVMRPRVLVADDSLTTRTLERSILQSAGYDVTVVPDGAEAWKSLQTLPFELLVSDIEMPGIDGIGLTERIRNDTKLRSLPVVLVSALAKPDERLRGLHAGADAYIVKRDFRQSDLVETVERLLGVTPRDVRGATP
jgi:two-component system chemotaxis sensor kinase CheA